MAAVAFRHPEHKNAAHGAQTLTVRLPLTGQPFFVQTGMERYLVFTLKKPFFSLTFKGGGIRLTVTTIQ